MAAKGKITLRHLTMLTERYEGAIKAMALGFHKEYPNTRVEVEGGIDAIPLMQRVDAELTAKSDYYSVFQHNSQLTATYGEPLQLLPLEDLIDDPRIGIREKEDYAKINWDIYTYRRKAGDEHVFGVPTDVNANIMYYRKDILRDHGFENSPQTIDECSEVIKETHSPPDHYGFICQMYELYAGILWLNLTRSFGGDIYDKKTKKATCNSEAGLRAMKMVVKWHTKYGVPGEETWGRPDFNANMGNLGKGVVSPMMMGNGMPQNPNLSKYADKVKTTVVPAGPARRYAIIAGVGCAVPAACKHPREAFMWIEWQQRKENMPTFIKAGGQPGRESALRNPKFQRMPNSHHFQALADTFATAAGIWGDLPEEYQIENLLAEECYPAILGKKTAKKALEDMERKLTTIMRKAGYCD